MDNVADLTNLMNNLLNQINSGFGAMQIPADRLMAILLVFNIVFAGFVWFYSTEAVVAVMVKKILTISIIIWIVRQWRSLTYIVYDSFITGGVIAGGGSVTPQQLGNPGFIAKRGVDLSLQIADKISSLTGPVAFFKNLVEIGLLGFAYIFIVLAFFVLALQMFAAILFFNFGALLALITMPFAVFKPTSFLAERPIAWVFASGFRVAALALVVAIAQPLITGLVPVDLDEITKPRMMAIILTSVIILAMAILAPKIASDLVSGSASLGAGDAAGAAAGGAAATAAVAAGGAAAVAGSRAGFVGARAAAAAIPAAARTGGGAASTVRTAAAAGRGAARVSRAGQFAGRANQARGEQSRRAASLLTQASSGSGGGSAPSL